MTAAELDAELIAAGVRSGVYSVSGAGDDDVYVLSAEAGGWSVYYAERGERMDERVHETEAAACEDLRDRVLNDPTTRE